MTGRPLSTFTVLGATGYIGSRLVAHLQAHGHAVWAPARGDAEVFTRPLGQAVIADVQRLAKARSLDDGTAGDGARIVAAPYPSRMLRRAAEMNPFDHAVLVARDEFPEPVFEMCNPAKILTG